MRAVRATFLLLLFVTSFARCWADTHGLLAASALACCEPVELAHFCDHDDHSKHESHNEHDQDGHEHEEIPVPEPFPPSDCSGCVLVKSGFVSSVITVDSPNPVFVNFIPEWNDLDVRIQRILSRAEKAQESPPPWSIDHVAKTTSEIVMTSTVSVRGPNLV